MEKEKEGILLESGTNEIEIMKFTIQGEFYGINVAKVKEIREENLYGQIIWY